jgi:isopropylmalate/homocitrate/citramalate synthase
MKVTICDVGPRDGLQNEARTLPSELRAELVNRLAATGAPRVEAASFVHPERVPQMAGAEKVVAAIERRPGVEYAGLVLNETGYERFAATDLDRLHFTLAATETFNERNAGMSVDESVAILAGLPKSRPVTVSISASFGCPFEGEVAPETVLALAQRLVEAGADEVVFADTIGVAVPSQVRALLWEAAKLGRPLGVHFHNTRNTGFANASMALSLGYVTLFDASVGGLGGCPFAPRATGNIATEDLVYMLHGQGVQTGIDLEALIGVAEWLEGVLGHELPGQVYRAGLFAPVAG